MPDKIASSSKDFEIADNPPLQKAVSALRRMRYFRRQYDQRRSYFYRQYLGYRDGKYYPDNITPRSNTFVPYPLQNVEQTVSRVDDAFFSTDPWFECWPRASVNEDGAEKMALVEHYCLHRSNWKSAFESTVRSIAIYGHAALKVDWDFDYDIVNYMEPIPAINPDTGQPMIQMVPDMAQGGIPVPQPIILGYRPNTKKVPRNRPKFIPIDVYDLLIDPDGGIIAHLTERTFGQMLREFELNPQLYDAQGFQKLQSQVMNAQRESAKRPEDIVVRIAEVWDEYDKTQTVLTFGEDAEAIYWKDLRASFRASSYSPYKRDVLAREPVLLYNGPIPFNHKRAPILHTSYIKLPNEIYGLGQVEIISDLVEALCKMVNMVTDNWNLGINHRYAYDTAADIDHEALASFNVPGGKVAVSGNPSEVIMPLPFFTPQAGDYQILELYKGMIESTSGISDFYAKGVGSPSGNRTATGISSIMNESNFRFKLFIRNLEIDIIQPMLEMVASMVQQYVQDTVEIQITGEPPMIKKWVQMTPEELVGTFDFRLIAANYATNKVLKQRNFLALMQMLAQTPFLNLEEAAKEALKLFEIPNPTRLLHSPEQVAMMQQAQLEQQIQMMLLESAANTEGKARLQQSKPTPGGKDAATGRPRRPMQPEGKIPGAGLTGTIRELAQNLTGANAMGLEGMGEMSEG